MADVDHGVTGAKVQTWKKLSARSLLAELVEDHPELDEAGLLNLFEAECAPYFKEIVAYWFTNNYRAIKPRQTNGTTHRREAKQHFEAVAVTRAIEVASKLQVLNLVLPSGVTVGKANADQLDEGSEGLKKLAKKLREEGPPGAVWDEVFTEDDARAVLES
jgi:hypothetical protein